MANRSADVDLQPLQVREEAADGFTDDLGTRTAFTSDHPAAFVFDAGKGAFFAIETCFHKSTSSLKALVPADCGGKKVF